MKKRKINKTRKIKYKYQLVVKGKNKIIKSDKVSRNKALQAQKRFNTASGLFGKARIIRVRA